MARRVVGLLARQLGGVSQINTSNVVAQGLSANGTRSSESQAGEAEVGGWDRHLVGASRLAAEAAAQRPKVHPDGTENRAGTCVRLPGRLSVQETYAPLGAGFGWRPQAGDGLMMKSYRTPGGLESEWTASKCFEGAPGVLADGLVSCLLDNQGNWTAALALMDFHSLRAPPLMACQSLTLTRSSLVPAPATQPLIVRAFHQEPHTSDGVTFVPVTMTLSTMDTNPYKNSDEVVLATGSATYIKIGAMLDIRSMVAEKS
eukprot:CAMPEP_0196582662 /NCGR_PEP_ID=MMETSP1081-20130531/40012_1 /TAXON_ID=36882 /ORGANISM="Pyramimonas amylifera, Strain CCMP720" /LENGTH=258 /DNA_ID=CAMNT_0041903297 /DNA_START=282 /DNA_END=1058 /DNA_ORIENTATION=-